MFRSVISPCRLMPTSGEKTLPRSNSSLSATHRSKSARAAAALSASLFRPRPEASARSGFDDPQSSIRAALRRRRRALGLTQEATARLLGMKRLTYHRIETGARHIHFADLAAICDAFHCAPGELLAAAFTRAAHALLPDALE